MAWQPEAADDFLTPAEVAVIFFVDPKTVTRWAQAGKLDSVRTPGGHRRFLKSDVLALLSGVRERHPSLVLSTKRTVEMGRAAQSSLGAEVRLTFPAGSPLSEQGAAAERAPEDAAAAVAEAVAIAVEAEAALSAEAVLVTAAAVVAAAEKAADAASRAREARAFAAAEAARLVADDAARTAGVVHSRARTAATQDSEVAAQEVATAVAVAAARMAKVVTAADIELESEVAAAAEQLRDLTEKTAHRAAIETDERALGVAIAAGQAAAAMTSQARANKHPTPDREGYALW